MPLALLPAAVTTPTAASSSLTSPAPAASTLGNLLAHTPQLWRGREPNRSQRTLGTGHARLDRRLPGSGWPVGALTELIAQRHGLGEFSLLFPALAEISHKGEWLVLIDPPWIPYPAALQGHGLMLQRLLLVRTTSAGESLWACEQALRGSRGGAVLAWPEWAGYPAISFARLRRLQLAAEAGAKPAFLFRPDSTRNTASPAALRLYLHGSTEGDTEGSTKKRSQAGSTCLEILKSRGQHSREPLWLNDRYPRPDRNNLATSRPMLRHGTAARPTLATTNPIANSIPGPTLN